MTPNPPWQNGAAWPGATPPAGATTPAQAPQDVRRGRQDNVIRQRVLTLGGNQVSLTVPSGDTAVIVTFIQPEVDASYGVVVTPSWHTSVWVTSKTTTGYTLLLGTAPSGNATCDCHTFRDETQTPLTGTGTSGGGGDDWGGGGGGAVSSVFGRTGAVAASSGDYTVTEVTGAAPLASPALTGTPTAPTASGGTNTTQLATTAFVHAAIPSVPVTSVFTRTGSVTGQTGDYAVAQITGAAPLASPALTGVPTAPTASPLTSDTQLATTAYVDAAVTAGGGGGATWKAVEVNLGTRPIYDASFTITDGSITTASHLAVVPSAKVPSSGSLDDWRWDGGTFAAVAGSGTATVHASFFPGPVSGVRSLNYQIG